MQNLDGYTTVSTWGNGKRATGASVDEKWFRVEVAAGRIPSIKVARAVFVKASDMEAAWIRYLAWRGERAKARSNSIHSARSSNNERILKSIAEIDRKLTQVLNILEA